MIGEYFFSGPPFTELEKDSHKSKAVHLFFCGKKRRGVGPHCESFQPFFILMKIEVPSWL